jgi:hypothetical protein
MENLFTIKDISIEASRNALNYYHKKGRPAGRPSNKWLSIMNRGDKSAWTTQLTEGSIATLERAFKSKRRKFGFH